ncbi:MAG: gliding motility lipoprotein GldH [Cloacibacterium sp.]|nr:gliding motility lipoprotein GldH [Cloacibacterium sp.]
MDKKWILFFVFMILTSCFGGSEEVYMASVDGVWKKNEAKKIEFEVKDSQIPKNIIFVVRNNNDYPYSNLFLISTIKGDQNQILKTDTIDYTLAKSNGEWLGSGFGSTKEILFQYKVGYRFPANGKYRVEVKHGMRMNTLPGIEDLGVKLEPTKQP